ncbi:MAG: TonB family protein [Acidobacteria bacterium]|nr:TonB family protein [Acidobacteriota bacterium]
MFETALLESATQKMKTQTKWYFLATIIVYSLTLSALVAGSTVLVSPQLKEQFISVALVMPPPPAPAPAGGTGIPRRSPDIFVSRGFKVPTLIPRSLPPTIEELPEVNQLDGPPGVMPFGVEGGVEGGERDGVVGGVSGSTGSIAAPTEPPRPEVKTPAPTMPRRISGGVLQGNAIRRVQPVYPLIARSARVSGSVQIEVIIDENGNVISATVVQGHPLLQQAALEAAQQWKFRPTLLSGEPIKVTGVLVFNFRL